MRRRHLLQSLALPALVGLALVAPIGPATRFAPPAAAAQNTSALINQALDKQVNLQLNDTLGSALAVVDTQTGVPIRVDASAWDMLPWGDQTKLTAEFKNQTLRQALTAITQKLGLTFTVGDEAVIIQPMPALRRLPGRATVQELKAVDVLAATPLAPPGANAPRPDKVQGLVTAVDQALDKLNSPFAVENRLGTELRDVPVNVPRNASLLDALEEIPKQTTATWYPWGKSIVVLPKKTLVHDLLSLKTFTARYTGTDLGQVLQDLQRRVGVEFTTEPGALLKVPAEFRMVKVYWDNVTVAQALESLKGVTGLDYAVTDNGVAISHPAPSTQPAGGGAGAADPVVGAVTLENGMQVFIRESQVPADLRQYMKYRAQKDLDSIRAMAKQEGYPLGAAAPETRPAGGK